MTEKVHFACMHVFAQYTQCHDFPRAHGGRIEREQLHSRTRALEKYLLSIRDRTDALKDIRILEDVSTRTFAVVRAFGS